MNGMPITGLFREAERLESAGNPAAAAELYKHWIALHPADPHLHAALFNHAVVQARLGDKPGAINTLRDAIRLKPDFHPPYITLGRLMEDLGQQGSAVAQWLELVHQLAPVNGENLRHKLMVLQQVARVLENNHVDEAAEDALRQAIDLRPDQPEVVQHWIALRQRQCKWPVVEGWDGVSRAELLANISPLSSAVMLDDPMFQLARAAGYSRRAIGTPALPPPAYDARRQPRPERLKIGYVSSDLREHAVGFGMSEVLELHDRERFEIHAYYCGIDRDDPTKARIRDTVDSWTSLNGVTDDAAADRIRADGIDILIDVNGYTRDARTAVFARRPAPIQVNWFGFPGTMGTPYHHYIIADPYVIPEGNERFFSEKVVRLPCYQPNDRRREVAEAVPSRVDENLPERGFVFCCLNGSQKITEPVFTAWMTVLKAVPGSVLWLLDSIPTTNARLRGLAAAEGVEPGRLCFAPKRPNPQHLARYRLADLFLDTFPYGAHTTASDAMWMGVPVLTLAGRSFAARVCAGLVAQAGFPELIATDLHDYARRAVAIAGDPALAAMLKERMRPARHATALFDTPRLVQSLEDLYDRMWSDFLEGRLPVPDLRNLDLYAEAGIARHTEDTLGLGLEAHYQDWFSARHAHATIAPDQRLWPRQSLPVEMARYRLSPPPQSVVAREVPSPVWLQKVGRS
jgi:predicted O-linked N-acetylglucosamine transferase (SPINDLY family)